MSGEGTSTPTLQRRKRSQIFPGRQGSSELWLPGGHHIFVSLAGFQILSLDLCLNMTQ